MKLTVSKTATGVTTTRSSLAKDASVLPVKLVQNGILKIYPGFSHGTAITEAETINADLLKFIES